MDLTNLQALLNDQKASSHSEWTSHQLAFRLLHTRQQHLTDGLGAYPLLEFPSNLFAANGRKSRLDGL